MIVSRASDTSIKISGSIRTDLKTQFS
jgi:hypothetical protein